MDKRTADDAILQKLVAEYRSSHDEVVDWSEIAESMNRQLSQLREDKTIRKSYFGVPSVSPSSNYESFHTPRECLLRYRNALDPSFNRSPWSAEEDANLTKLAIKYAEHEWPLIATELGTNRTPFDCLNRYQQHLNNHMIHSKDWSKAEDEKLKEVVHTHGANHWAYISSMIVGRTADQCRARYGSSQSGFVAFMCCLDGIKFKRVSHKAVVVGVAKKNSVCFSLL